MDENTEKKSITVDLDELSRVVNETVEKALKADTDSVDRKYGVLPVELSEDEKKLSQKDQNVIKFNKYIRAIFKKDMKYLNATKAINVEGGNGTTGGFLTNPEFNAEVIRLTEQYGVMRREARTIKMNSQKLLMPRATAKVTGGFVNEASQKAESNPTFDQLTLSRNEYAVLSVVSKQLLEDSEVNLLPLLSEFVAEDFAYSEDFQGFQGVGTPITGIVNTVGINKLYTSSTDFSSMTGDDLIDMTFNMSASKTNGAKFYMHRSAMALIRKLKVDDWYIYDRLGEGNNGTIAGYPYELVEAMPAVADGADANNPYIIFGNLKNVYFGDRLAIETAMTTDATIGSNNLFEKNLVGFRFEESYDIKVAIPSAFTVLFSKES